MKKLKHFLSILFVSFCSLLGCGYLPHYYYTVQPNIGQTNYIIYVKVDREFSDTDKLAIDKAIFQWNYVLNGHYKMEVVDWEYDATEIQNGTKFPNDAYYIVKINSKQFEEFKKYFKEEDKKKFVLAFANTVGGTIAYVVRDRLQQDDVYYILMHELAHMLGAQHDNFRLMNPYHTHERFQCVDWKTAEQVAKFLGLNVNDLNWCFYLSDFDTIKAESVRPIYRFGPSGESH